MNQLPMWDRTGENQVYVRQQKVAEEQQRFDKGLALSRTPSRTFAAAVYHVRLAGLALAVIPGGLRGNRVRREGAGPQRTDDLAW